MRVAIVSGPYIPVPPLKYGGTERVVWNLVKGLKEAGHEPILFASGDSKPGCKVIPIVDKHIFFPRTTDNLPAFQKKVKEIHKNTIRLLRENLSDIDIIHSHDIDILDFQNFPNLTTVHGPILFNQFKYFERRKNLFFASISKNQQEAFPNLQWVGAVYNGENPSDFPLVRKPDDYVCFVGRFDREKNPHLAIELAISYGIKIKLAGKIDFLGDDYFKSEVKKYLKHPLVEYLGELNPRDTNKILGHSKLNLHPATTFREPFGLTVLEAAYGGTPTMAIDKGSMPELIEKGKTGLLVEDFVEGYHQLEECFGLDREYISKRAGKLFNYEVMTKQYIKAYNKVQRIFRIREREAKKIHRITSRSVKELEAMWERDAQGRMIPSTSVLGETKKKLNRPLRLKKKE